MEKYYHVASAEHRKALLQLLEKRGFKWANGDSLCEEDGVDPDLEVICTRTPEKTVTWSKLSHLTYDQLTKLAKFTGRGSSDEIRPDYYKNGGHDLFDHFTEIMPTQGFRGFMIGNIFKYVTRYPAKNGIEDLRKARTYLDRLIQFEKDKEGETNDTTRSNS